MRLLSVAHLYVYPIKSCGGIRVESLNLCPYGPQYDRQFVIVDTAGQSVTQRTHPKLCLIETAFWGNFLTVQIPGIEGLVLSLERKDGVRLDVIVWDDKCIAIDEGNWIADALSSFLGQRVRLARYLPNEPRVRHSSHLGAAVSISFADAYPLLVITEASLKDLNKRLPRGHEPLEMNRFRPNIVIGSEIPEVPYEEDEWPLVSINGLLLRGVNQCVRCSTTLVDQATGRLGKEPLRTLEKYRKTPKGVVFGRNFIHLGEGTIHVGDTVDTP